MTADLTGRVVVVTGGNRGIGLALAEGVVGAGADVAIWARDEHMNDMAVKALQAAGGRAVAIACDVADPVAVEAAAEATRHSLGPIDAMFANAGLAGDSVPLLEIDLREWRRVQQVNVEGVLLCFQAAARQMVETGRPGALCGVSSLAARFGTPRRPHYAASKAAVLSLCKTVAVELARHRIRCNALVPGWIDTAMLDHSRDNAKFVEATTTRTPLRRWGTASDLAAAAIFLADPEASFHTGDRVVVDGGYSVY